MSYKVYVQTKRILSRDQLKDLEYELKKKDENIVLLPYGVKVVKPEVIYCKECKHGQKRTKPYMYCDIFGAVMETEGFCSKAERKEE